MDLNLSNTGLVQLETEDQLNWTFRLRRDVAQWCRDNLEHPAELIVTQEVYGLTMDTRLEVRFETEAEAFHFKTRWWGK